MIQNIVQSHIARRQKIHFIFRLTKLRLHFLIKYIINFGLVKSIFTLTKLRSKKTGILTLIPPNHTHPVEIRLGTSDVSVFEKIFVWREYCLTNITFPVTQIIDCGGNTGLSAIWFARQFPSSRVIVIEPDLKNFDLLCKNVSYYSNIIPVHAAVWSTSCHVKIENPDDRPDSFRFAQCSPDVKESICAFDLSTILKNYNLTSIDILKIDIEGGEKMLFSENCNEWLAKTRMLLIEIHGEDCRHTVKEGMSHFQWSHCLQGENECFVKIT
jgi:FkbM family methyltransferase